MLSFGIKQNFESNARPLNSGLKKMDEGNPTQNYLSFSKLFEIWRSDVVWQMGRPKALID